MSKLAHSHQPTMDEIEARHRDGSGEIFNMDDEATIFAANLLVPEEAFKDDIARMSPVTDIDDEEWLAKLCKKYRVTRGLMLFRLRLHYQQR